MPFQNDEFPRSLCKHPEDRIEWQRNVLLCRWEGRCRKCGKGPGLGDGGAIIRTDEQIAQGLVPDIELAQKILAEMFPAANTVNTC